MNTDVLGRSDAAALGRAVLALASEDADARARALRTLKLDPAIGWDRFQETPESAARTRRRLGRRFPAALDRLAAEAARKPALRETVLAALAQLPGVSPWADAAVGKRLGKAGRDRLRALRFARDYRAYPNQLTLYLTHQCNSRCSYCFSLDDMDADKSYMSMENYLKILDWMSGQPFTYLNLIGGEPTTHPDFPDFVRLAWQRGFPVYLSTNNLYTPRVLEALRPPAVFNMTVHALDPDEYRPGQWETFDRNLGEVSARGIDLYLRYNLYRFDRPEPWRFLFDLCARHSLRRVNFAMTFPIASSSNVFVPTKDFREFAGSAVRFVRECVDRGIECRITKSFPICHFEPEDQALMMERCGFQNVCTLHRRDHTYNLVVRPDLSLDPCIALKWKRKSLLDFRSLEEIGAAMRPEIAALQRQPLFEQCPSCPIYELNVCQGACLAYKPGALSPEARPAAPAQPASAALDAIRSE